MPMRPYRTTTATSTTSSTRAPLAVVLLNLTTLVLLCYCCCYCTPSVVVEAVPAYGAPLCATHDGVPVLKHPSANEAHPIYYAARGRSYFFAHEVAGPKFALFETTRTTRCGQKVWIDSHQLVPCAELRCTVSTPETTSWHYIRDNYGIPDAEMIRLNGGNHYSSGNTSYNTNDGSISSNQVVPVPCCGSIQWLFQNPTPRSDQWFLDLDEGGATDRFNVPVTLHFKPLVAFNVNKIVLHGVDSTNTNNCQRQSVIAALDALGTWPHFLVARRDNESIGAPGNYHTVQMLPMDVASTMLSDLNEHAGIQIAVCSALDVAGGFTAASIEATLLVRSLVTRIEQHFFGQILHIAPKPFISREEFSNCPGCAYQRFTREEFIAGGLQTAGLLGHQHVPTHVPSWGPGAIDPLAVLL